MNELNKKILATRKWTIECESPFEIRHEDGSFATGQAANIVLHHLIEMFRENQDMNNWICK